ncbi:hypothetical protein JMF89_10465 [Clostridiaceae bacterium UIB06]|uniref:Uncharacterized protein n=1 Tax=Clostridium thailandense TaxID=2794346 RepID=A0A949X511_9CLOT|nr:hypothetical protein [Clostridium thailandense]MBV7274878.1 hypothetical protein [Clostridium thailandense]MCH5137624.1 hypothetical protein [Clostridiaceae bacterium UIB06]
MKDLKINTKAILVVALIMIVEWYGLKQYYKNYYKYTPGSVPKLGIMYENKEIVLKNADYNWFDKNSGGNSNIFGDPVETLKYYKPVDVKSEGSLQYVFTTNKPPKIILITIYKNVDSQWKPEGEHVVFYSDVKEGRRIQLPKEKGIYIYKIEGIWDDTHTTSNIFKINVN